MELKMPLKNAIKQVLELEWLQEIIKILPLLLLKKLESYQKIGNPVKITMELCKEKNLDNLLEDYKMKDNKIKELETYKTSN